MIQNEKFGKLATVRPELNNYYKLQNNGFYKCSDISCEDKEALKIIFKELGFSALNFTDSRGVFQFYNFRTKHDTLMGGKRGYIFDKDNVLAEIKTFIQEQSC